jgi:hypothetical protein
VQFFAAAIEDKKEGVKENIIWQDKSSLYLSRTN